MAQATKSAVEMPLFKNLKATASNDGWPVAHGPPNGVLACTPAFRYEDHNASNADKIDFWILCEWEASREDANLAS